MVAEIQIRDAFQSFKTSTIDSTRAFNNNFIAQKEFLSNEISDLSKQLNDLSTKIAEKQDSQSQIKEFNRKIEEARLAANQNITKLVFIVNPPDT